MDPVKITIVGLPGLLLLWLLAVVAFGVFGYRIWQLVGLLVAWLDHQLAERELLKLDVASTHLVVEHEYPKARIQDKARLKPILQGSIAFTRKVDEAAACMHALQNVVLKAQGIPVQGDGRQPYRS